LIETDKVIGRETMSLLTYSAYVAVKCETKLFQNYFRRLLQLTNIFQHVQCR